MITLPMHFKAMNREVRFQLPIDDSLRHDAGMLELFRSNRIYESETVLAMFHILRPGDFAIDIGANIGFFTMLMARLVGETGQIIACEARPDGANRVAQTVAINKVENVHIVSGPMASSSGSVDFYIDADDVSSSTRWDPGLWFENDKSRGNQHIVKLEAKTLDSLTMQTPRLMQMPRLIKLDTEGCELDILRGAERLLKQQRPPFILSEMNWFGLRQMGASDEEFRSFMREHGYDMFMIHFNDEFPALVPPQVKLRYYNDIAVVNVLFSDLDSVAEAYPETVF